MKKKITPVTITATIKRKTIKMFGKLTQIVNLIITITKTRFSGVLIIEFSGGEIMPEKKIVTSLDYFLEREYSPPFSKAEIEYLNCQRN